VRAPAQPLAVRLATLFPEASGRSRKRWLAEGRVRVDDHPVRDGREPVAADAAVALGPRPAPALAAPLRLVHEDADLLVVEKPPGLLTIATERERERTAYHLVWEYLAAARPPRRPFVVHRLDRETSGLLVVAKTPAAKEALQAQFAGRRVERVYEAVVEGVMADEAGTLESSLVEDRNLRVRSLRAPRAPRSPRLSRDARPVRGPSGRRGPRPAITHFRVSSRRADVTRLVLRLGTGRRHQIRVQLAERGHPIVGDRLHGSRHDPLRRLCLHATRLGFVHPTSGRPLVFESPAPPAFARLGSGPAPADAPKTGRTRP
jgi:23S rRNA pseudouridine1911/1915/1917 synthase